MQITEGTKVIYEPAFIFSDVLVALDIICPNPALPHGKEEASLPSPLQRKGLIAKPGWIAYEVKSSAKISSNYILDAALQYWVIKNSGIELDDFFIVNIDTKYVRKRSLEINNLFARTSVLEEIIRKQPFIEENIAVLKNMLYKNRIPEIPIGSHCFSPYHCDFLGQCWKDEPLKAEVECGEKIFHNKGKLNEFLKNLKYPLLFVDFEVMMPAVPIFENTSPFQNIPFQYSIYRNNVTNLISFSSENFSISGINADFNHTSFLAEPGLDPRKDFIENFLKESEGEGSIIVYDSLLEKSILNSLKKEFPVYASQIDQRIGRIIDLIIPFRNNAITSEILKKTISLKDVSNALLPDKKFDKLKIKNGRLSMIAYEGLMKETDLLKIIETKEALEEYCKTDTEAMAGIVAVLQEMVRDENEKKAVI